MQTVRRRSPAGKKGSGTSPTRPTIANTGPRPDSAAVPASAAIRQRRKGWIARDGWRLGKDRARSLRFLLSRIFPESLLGFFDVIEGEAARFHQMGHHQLGPAAEERQQFVNQPALGIFTGDCGFENIGVADPLDATEGLLPFQAIDGGLYGGISRPAELGKRFLNLANGAGAFLPERFQDLQFQFGQLRNEHGNPTVLRFSLLSR